MTKEVDFLTRLPRELAFQVIEHFEPNEYIRLRRVSKQWYTTLTNNTSANSIIRKHFAERSDLREYADVPDRFAALRNLTFRQYAHSEGLAMKTKRFTGTIFSAINICRGHLVCVNEPYGTYKDIIILNLDRNATTPPVKVESPRLKDVYAFDRLIMGIKADGECEAFIWDYKGEFLYKWSLQLPNSNGNDRRYLIGLSSRYAIVRTQEDIWTERVPPIHYEIFDTHTASVARYDIPGDILSDITMSARKAEQDAESEDYGFHGDLSDDWAISEAEIKIIDDKQTFSLWRQQLDEEVYHVQRFSFASSTELQEISKSEFTVRTPTVSQHEDPDVTWSYAARNRGIMTATTNAEDDEYLDVVYLWYDHSAAQDGVQNIRKYEWMVQSYINPFEEYGSAAFFPMGDTLYALLKDDESDFIGIYKQSSGELEFDTEPVKLGSSLGPDDIDSADVTCNDRHACLMSMTAITVVEWHDYDSWKESQDINVIRNADSETIDCFWAETDADGNEERFENFRYE